MRLLVALLTTRCFCVLLFRYYPLFYVVQSCVMNARWDAPTATEGLERCRANWTTDMINCWKLWVPMQAINFSVCPVHMRVTFAAAVSFLWSGILSALRGDMKPIASVRESMGNE